MEPTIRAITCPCCGNILYALEINQAAGGNAWKMTADSPGTSTWTVSAKQSCDRVLP